MSYPFASLTSGLLARKGAAQPAMVSHSGGNPLRMAVSEPKNVAAIQSSHSALDHAAAPSVSHLPAPAPGVGAGPVARQAAIFRPVAALQQAGYATQPEPPPFPPERAKSALPMRAIDAPAPCGGSTACGVGDAAIDPARRFHVSVRLRQSHFVRLKIASAQLRKPSQDIVAEALEAHFRSLDPNVFGDCACARGG